MTVGLHCIIDIHLSHEDHIERLQDLEAQLELLSSLAQKANAQLLNVKGHNFGEGQGVTCVAMLAESHITMHSWPEISYGAYDMFICGLDARDKIETAVDYLHSYYNGAKFNIRYIDR